VASMMGLVGSTPIKQANYAASKGAVINMTRELALQWARKGVRVNALCPGWFPSEMTAPMETDEGSQRFIATHSPMPRMGHGHELDGPLLLLASDAGSFMTGATLLVDGGWTAR
jgi:NAD(P)-dependent dehydrogenase (short-subunit alcohol dehydrogenase family)